MNSTPARNLPGNIICLNFVYCVGFFENQKYNQIKPWLKNKEP